MTPSQKKKAKDEKPAIAEQSQPGTQVYEKRLTEMRGDIMNLVQHKQKTELTDQEVGDEADAATQSAERELLFELSDNERQMLDAIEAALRKIKQNRYGVCESCNKKIPRERLKFIPHARYCVTCQTRFERPR